MSRAIRGAACAVLLTWSASAVGQAPADDDPEPPRDIGLVERTGTRLAQIDVTALGTPEALASLTADDFVVKINRGRLTAFRLDRQCLDGPATAATAADAAATAGAGQDAADVAGRVAPAGPASYLLYFDQSHLTMAGRRRAIDLARDLVPEILARPGDRAMIVSNAARLAVVEPFSDDPETLLEALGRLDHDSSQFDVFPSQEDERVAEVLRTLNEEELVQTATAIARQHGRDERLRTERSVRRLTAALGQLVDVEPPKAVIYFADTLRKNAGEHYLSFFGGSLREQQSSLGLLDTDSFEAGAVFDRMINTAAAQSIRFYTVQAEGLMNYLDPIRPTSRGQALARTGSGTSRIRLHHAQDTLSDIAAETGGAAFLNGVPARRIAERITADAACLFLISFDPTPFREDSALRVKVELRDRPDVELRVRGRIVLPSEETRRTSRILRAFSAPDAISDPFDVRPLVVPTGHVDGEWSALLQVAVPATPFQGATWDIGATLVRGDDVRHESSGRLSLSGPDVPVVYEAEVLIGDGVNEVVAVAHEASSGLIASSRLDLEWPRLERDPLLAGPTAVMQPVAGAFLRDGDAGVRASGALALSPGDAVDAARPTAFVTLACRGRRDETPPVVTRRLVGAGTVDFPDQALETGDDRCAQLRDVIPGGTLGPGGYRYEVRLLLGERVAAERIVDVVVAGSAGDPAEPVADIEDDPS